MVYCRVVAASKEQIEKEEEEARRKKEVRQLERKAKLPGLTQGLAMARQLRMISHDVPRG